MTDPLTDESTNDPQASRRGFFNASLALGGMVVGAGAAISAVEANSPLGAGPVNPRLFSFVGGQTGDWRVISSQAITGEPLPVVDCVDFVTGAVSTMPEGAAWILRGVTSNARYLTRSEKDDLVKRQVALGRASARLAALIPIRKNAAWWDLTQDERRAIFEEKSRHNAIGMKYLPAIARRLHHCRDLGESEPFDFSTLFDYAETDAAAFDDLVAALRETEEWKYVDREVDIRLQRIA